MSLVDINWKPDARQLRKTGWTLLIGFALIAGAMLLLHRSLGAIVCMAVAVVLGGIALTAGRAGLWVYRLWMAAAFILGNITSRLVLAMFYYLILTPMALILRLLGRDKLCLRRIRADSHWKDMPASGDPSQYERQF